MDILSFDLSQLIPQVSAQELDGVLQPTFGELNLSGTSGSTASIKLTSSATSVGVGQKFDVDIEVKTNAFSINEYRIVIDFNPTKLSVVDADSTKTGTQIKFQDTVFQVDGTNNTVSSVGRITLIAKTPTGNALQVNRKVATINFQAQATGSTTISGVSGTSGSQLINQNGVAIQSTINNVTVAVSTQQSTSSSSSSSSSGSSSSSSGTIIIPPGSIPDTSLPPELTALIPVVIGAILIGTGIALRRSRQKHEHHK